MRVCIIYQPNSEHERSVLDFVRDFKLAGHGELELISLDTISGSEIAKLYGIMSYPAVMAISHDGQLQKLWDGEMLPLMSEVAYYSMQ
jgi:hypothetical protein